ncbi:MAG: competence/damage-inducible protein CinA C-terminal domain protein [Rhodospirillales bacterium]|nr:competence/damage-inducible protein CinA C-terminal domain protein [Rhodospirillales bacterium]
MTETLSPALPTDIEAAVHRVLEALCDRDLTVATAESCTGGLLASLLTDVEGCGRAFDRGFVTYTDAAKHSLLGVASHTLETAGAVSREAAIEMAQGALENSQADIAVAITGFAGPGGPGDLPGLVHFAVACRDHDTVHALKRFAATGRGDVRIAALRCAIGLIGEAIERLGDKAPPIR